MMNQEQIGKFIASARKKQKLTQEQLAEKLNITSKAVSKWECGKSLPDASIMLDLCNILKIDVNELLMGKKLNKDEYEKSDKNKIVKYTLVFVLVILAFIIFNNIKIPKWGITKDVQITIQNNNTDSSEEINKVIKKLKSDFKSFYNCYLLTINYDSKKQIEKYDDNNYYDIMVLDFSFIVEGESEGLAIGETYNYTAYYGKKTTEGSWDLINWGQG